MKSIMKRFSTSCGRILIVLVALGVLTSSALTGAGAAPAHTQTSGTWSSYASNPVTVSRDVFESISCATTTFCEAVTQNGNAYKFNGTTWSVPDAVTPNWLTAISCPTSTFCEAVDQSGNAYTFNGTSWSAATPVTPNWLTAISCPTTSECVAGDVNGDFFAMSGTSWSANPVNLVTGAVSAISCPATTFCEEVDQAGNMYTYNGSTWTPYSANPASQNQFATVSCPTTTFCVAGDITGDAFTFNGTSWSAYAGNPASSGFMSISCPTTTFCEGVDIEGDAYTFNGTSWATYTDNNVFANQMSAVSCPTATFCEAVDYSGNAYTYSVSSSAPQSSCTSGTTTRKFLLPAFVGASVTPGAATKRDLASDTRTLTSECATRATIVVYFTSAASKSSASRRAGALATQLRRDLVADQSKTRVFLRLQRVRRAQSPFIEVA